MPCLRHRIVCGRVWEKITFPKGMHLLLTTHFLHLTCCADPYKTKPVPRSGKIHWQSGQPFPMNPKTAASCRHLTSLLPWSQSHKQVSSFHSRKNDMACCMLDCIMAFQGALSGRSSLLPVSPPNLHVLLKESEQANCKEKFRGIE